MIEVDANTQVGVFLVPDFQDQPFDFTCLPEPEIVRDQETQVVLVDVDENRGC